MTDFGKELEAANARRKVESRMQSRQRSKDAGVSAIRLGEVPKNASKSSNVSYRDSQKCRSLSEFMEEK